ncbi:MAG: VOC family protein [Erysipelotrichaceae bacterium]|nr:VOC family protein [Erysipelotrichaceae bacterium]MDY5252679.1 VOC family protein [Erysipelotrichaceae bacterium]
MIGQVVHIGLSVSDMEQSIAFYRDILGLKLVERMIMDGENTDLLFAKKNMRAELAYLNAGDDKNPPIELICFMDDPVEKRQANLHETSISEVCFYTDDIDKEYARLKSLGVEFISSPQTFELGHTKSKAVYFKDPDGIILELMEVVA